MITKIIKTSAALMFTVMLFAALNRLVSPKYATDIPEGSMIGEYYDAPKDHQVIFIGDCEVYSTYDPVLLFEEYGITSYLRGTPQQLVWQSYYILKETFRYEDPQVVVFNVNSMRHPETVSEEYNHLTIDRMRWSADKLGIIDASLAQGDSFIYYLLPLARYHDRIFSLTKEDFSFFFRNETHTVNGFVVTRDVVPYTGLPAKRPLSDPSFSDGNYAYLEAMAKLCEDNGAKLVLVKAPSLYPYWYDEYEEQIEAFAAEHGISYLNLLEHTDEIGLDYSEDTYDGGLHVNFSGAQKVSRYFGNWLKDLYTLDDLRSDREICDEYDDLKTRETEKK